MAVNLEQQREIREHRRGTWDGTEEQARSKYESHPQMQEMFPTFEDYLDYLGAYEQRLQNLDEATVAFEENIQNFTPTEYDQEAVNNFDINTDYTGPVGVDAIREALAGVQTPDAAGMDVVFGTNQTYQELQNEYGLTDNTQSIREGDNVYVWNGTEFEKRDVGESLAGQLIKGAVAGGFALALGPVVGQALGVGSTGFVGGAVSGATGSAIGQGVVTGSIDTGQVAVAALTGGIAGLAEAVNAGDLAGSALDNAIWDMSERIGVDFETTANIIEGAARGAVTGQDVESIVAGAVGGWSASKLESFAYETFGDVVDVDNFLREGSTSIDTAALYPVIQAGIQTAVEGGISPEDALRTTVDYFSEGGSLDFLLPALPDMADNLNLDLDVALPEIDFDLGFDVPNVNLDIDIPFEGFDSEFNNPFEGWDPNVNNPFEGFDPNINNPFEGFDPNIDLPPVDVNVPKVDINVPEVDVNVPEVDVPEVNVEGPDASLNGPDIDIPSVDLPSMSTEPTKPYESSFGGLFDYMTITPYTPKPLPQAKLDAIRGRRGMLS